MALELGQDDKINLEFRGPAREIGKRAPLANMVYLSITTGASLVWTPEAGIKILEE